MSFPPESLDRSVCPILLTRSPTISFRASISFSSFSSRSYHPVSSFAAVVALGWHRSARSNLISSCKFNYWLTAPRRRALYLLLASPRASRYSCLGQVLILLFSSFLALFLTAPRREQTHLGVLAVFAGLLRLRFLGETLRGTRLLVSGRTWVPPTWIFAV